VVEATVRRRLPGGLSLTRQGWLATLINSLGAEDIEVGDPEFDAKVVVKGASSDEVRALLADPDLRLSLIEAFAHIPDLTIKDGNVTITLAGLVKKADALEKVLTTATSVSQALEAATEKALAEASRSSRSFSRRTWRLRSADSSRIFMLALLVPLFLMLYILILAVPSMLPLDFPIWARFVTLGVVTAGLVTFAIKKAPRPSKLELTDGTLRLRDGKGSEQSFPLSRARWGLGPWTAAGQEVGAILYLSHGDDQVRIGGRGADPRALLPVDQHVQPAQSCDLFMEKDEFRWFFDSFGQALGGRVQG
jgi:hypothetical protein